MLELLSVHVPKCAGLTMRAHLLDHYGPDDLLLDYGGSPRPARLLSEYSSHNWSTPDRRRCIHGFFNLRKYEAFQARWMVTCLREPVKRVISHYWYWMHVEGADNPMVDQVRSGRITLLDLARHPDVSGLYTRLLFDGADMRTFDVIGDVDDLGAYLTQIGALLGVPLKKKKLVNANPETAYAQRVGDTFADTALMTKLRDVLAYETRFYEKVVGRGLLSTRWPTAAFHEREGHRMDIMLRHPTKEESWPPRLRSKEEKNADLENEIRFFERHAGKDPAEARLAKGELNERDLVDRDFSVAAELDHIFVDGLSSEAKVIDIGAGVFRLGYAFIPYLCAGNYFALEANRAMIDWGYANVIERNKWSERFPRSNVIEDESFNFSWASGQFDVAIASFVFDRLPLAALEQCLRNLAGAMKPNGHFYLSYCALPEVGAFDQQILYTDGAISFPDRAPFHWRIEDLAATAQKAGWTLESSLSIGGEHRAHYHQARLRCGPGGGSVVTRAPRQGGTILYWWHSQDIWRQINSLLGDADSATPWSGYYKLIARTAGAPLKRGLAINCADGARELRLLLTGAVEHFDLWDPSPEMIEIGKAEASRFGLGGRVTWHVGDPRAGEEQIPDDHDLVCWTNTLQKERNVEAAIDWSLSHLAPGGVLASDGYVGPSHFQWSDIVRQAGARLRETLPARLRRGRNGRLVPVVPPRPGLEDMRDVDIPVAPDSDRILAIARDRIPDVTIVPTGGCIYQLALQDILHNFDLFDHGGVLNAALILDQTLLDMGHTHYASFAGRKPVERSAPQSTDASEETGAREENALPAAPGDADSAPA